MMDKRGATLISFLWLRKEDDERLVILERWNIDVGIECVDEEKGRFSVNVLVGMIILRDCLFCTFC